MQQHRKDIGTGGNYGFFLNTKPMVCRISVFAPIGPLSYGAYSAVK
jgi:hypothetical protein